MRVPVVVTAFCVSLVLFASGSSLAQTWKRDFSPNGGGVNPSQTASRGAWGNPALIPEVRTGDQTRVVNAGLFYVNDADDLLRAFKRTREEARELERTSQQRPLLPGDADELIAALENQDGKLLTASFGGELAIALPWLPRADLVGGIRMAGRFATGFNYAEQDAATLQAATVFGAFNAADLESRILASGVFVTEVFVSHAQDIAAFGGLRVGATLKHQRLTLFEREIEIDEYSEGDLRNRSRNVATYNHPNLDIGISKLMGDWQASLSVRNLNGRRFEGNADDKYAMKPAVSLGLNYHHNRWLLSANTDVTPSQSSFGQLDDERRLRIGAQYQWRDNLALRLGSHLVLEGRDRSAASFGLSWRLFEHTHLQFGWIFAGSREQGGNIQLAMGF